MRATGWIRAAIGASAAVALTGCWGSAVVIHHNDAGGVVGLEGDREASMADARRQMSEQCNGAYTIVGARNVAAGTYRGRMVSEYQLRYLCGVHPDRAVTPTPPEDREP